jgi:hypothetical protein
LAKVANGDIADGFFGVFSTELWPKDPLVDEGRWYSDVFLPLLNKRKARGIHWVSNILTAHRQSGAVAAVTETTQADREKGPPRPVLEFEAAIRDAIANDPGDEASEPIRSLAPPHAEAVYLHDRDTQLPAFGLSPISSEPGGDGRVDLSMRLSDGRFERRLGVRLSVDKEPGTYHFKSK